MYTICFFGDDRGIQPRTRFELVPHIRAPLAPRGDIARRRRLRLRDRVEHLLRERRLHGNVLGRHFNARPVGMQHNVRGFGIEPEVEFVARVGRELRYRLSAD